MAIIYTYPLKATPILTDSVVITDSADDNKTKITSLQALFTAGLPGTGTVTSVKLDFDSTNGTDTGLRLWDGGAFIDTSQTITTTGSFEVGGVLFKTHGGTGHNAYSVGNILYDNGHPTRLEQLSIGLPGEVLTVNGGGTLPEWVAPGTGTVTNVGATNAIGAGIEFKSNPGAGITTTGTLDLSYSGSFGDILYADTPTSLAKLPAGIQGQVLSMDLSIPLIPTPYWKDPLAVSNQSIIPAISKDTLSFDFVGAGVVATSAVPGKVTVTIPGGGGGGGGNMAFSPVNVAACEQMMNMNQAILYLTIAEHDMTISKCTVWGAADGPIGNIEVGVWRWNAGWGTGAIMGGSPNTLCGYGPTDLSMIPFEPGNLTVTAGEWLIVGLVDNSEEATWFSVSTHGQNNRMFGQVDIASFPGILPENTPDLEEEGWFQSDQRFALTLWAEGEGGEGLKEDGGGK